MQPRSAFPQPSPTRCFPTPPSAQAPVKGGILSAGLQGGESTNSMDPALILSQVMFSFGKQWGEYLNRLKPDGGLENLIAEEIGASADAKTWTIKVRDGIEFHNGKTVTAEDVAATIERHADENSKSGALGILKNIKGVKASGKEVIVTLAEADADFPYLMADYHLIIQPNGGKDDPNAGISAGPYKVTVNEPGVRHGGERFANYWLGDKLGHADQVEIIVINDATARLSALQGGQVNMINRIEPKVVDLVKRVPGVSVEATSGRGFYPFNMFCDTAPFDNNDLRMALKLAMDRQELLDKILHGLRHDRQRLPDQLGLSAVPRRYRTAHVRSRKRRPSTTRSPAIPARSCCAPPTLPSRARSTRRSSTSRAAPRPASRSRSSASRVTATGRKSGTSSPSRCPTGVAARRSRRCTRPRLPPTADWNDTRFKRPEFDAMLRAAAGELDQDKRKAIYRDMGMLVRDEGGTIVPFFNQFIDAVDSNKVCRLGCQPAGRDDGRLRTGRVLADGCKRWLH